ncbi:CRISPR-associated endonuclease Cas2, partial [Deinococcus lacus]
RIQRSVFEVLAYPAGLRRLLATLERLLGPEDSVVAYRLNAEREWVGVLLPELPEQRVSLL